MSDTDDAARLESLVAGCVEDEARLEWGHVRRVPSTYTWKVVDYIRSLEAGSQTRLRHAFVSAGVFLLDPDRDPTTHPAQSGDEEYRRFVDAISQIWDWKYSDVRTLRAILGDQLGKRPSPEFANTPVEVLERARAIQPTNARDIRKAVKQSFQERYGARPENLGGGDWRYAGVHRGRSFVVSIDYGGWDQLRYEVEYEDVPTNLRAKRLSYERLVGAGLGHWDFLTADNLQESVTLLCTLLEALVELPDKLAVGGAA